MEHIFLLKHNGLIFEAMPASHHHLHMHHGAGNRARKNIRTAFLLNTFFAIVEIIGGFYSNSVAILSDALHDLGDSLSLGIAYYFQKKSEKDSDSHYSYGYGRFSLIGAFITSLILIAGSVIIIIEAVERFREPSQPDAKGMVIFALVGLAVNTVAMLRLRTGSSVNERLLSLHFMEDVLGWLAVLIGAIVMIFFDVPWLDPLLSLAIAVFILTNVYRNLRSAFRIVLQGVPAGISEDEVKATLLKIPGVLNVDHFHIWTMDGVYNVMTVHLIVEGKLTVSESAGIRKQVREQLGHLNVEHVTIEFEADEARSPR